MAIEITSAECDSVRKAIDIRLDEIVLPDDVILLPIYADYAVQKITDALPTSLDPEYESRAQSAAIFSCAALIVPAMKQLIRETIAGHEKQFREADLLRKAQELNNRADEIIASILGAIDGTTNYESIRPTFFTLAKANRADRS